MADAQNTEALFELPTPRSGDMATGHLIRVLERRLPGITDEWVESIQAEVEAHRAGSSKLSTMRPASQIEAVRRERETLLVWARLIRLIWRGTDVEVRRKKRKR